VKKKAKIPSSFNLGEGDPTLQEIYQVEELVRTYRLETCTATAIEQVDGTFALRVTLGREAKSIVVRIKHHNRPRLFSTIFPLLGYAKRFGFHEVKVQLIS
jgi:hypothetical protein